MLASRTPTRWLLLLAALALVATACGDTDGEDPGTAGDEVPTEEQAEGGEFSIYNCEPQSLIPQNSTEVCGSKVLDQLFAGLVEYDAETGEPRNVMAESIESDDQTNWTITIRDDFTFHDGTPVTAQSFVDAWNFAVDPEAANQNATFLDNFVGYDEVTDGSADTLTGLEAIDDTTISVELTEPFSVFPTVLGYTAFYPLPEVAFDDFDAFEDSPIGNGRYQMDGSWVRDQEIAMTRFDGWPSDLDPGLADRVVWTIYNDVNAAYLDVQAGNLDILDNIPPEREATVAADIGDENLIRTDTSTFTYIGFPTYQEPFDNPDVRRAFSLAVDRQPIIDAIFDGARIPAQALIAPSLPEQHRTDACEYCEFDPDRAQELLESAGGFDGPLTMYFNSGAGHEDWVEAVANQLQENLGIESVQFESLEFAQYLDLLEGQEIQGPFRLGWVLSYPSPQYALEPLYTTGSSSNYFGYANPQVDDAIASGNAAAEPDDADAFYQEAEDLILDDMPLIPMWFETRTSVFSDNVSNVIMDARTFIRVEQVQVNT
jgi:peptide/nickel transport system substrate-binding protein/oligopeptide transport system substrate-binding protein